MANEIKTTTTTDAGLVERVQADAIAYLRMESRLFGWITGKEAMNAGSVQYPVPDTPSGVIGALSLTPAEADQFTSTAHNAASRVVTLGNLYWQTTVSELDLRSGTYTEQGIARDAAGYVAGLIDRKICGQFSNFTQTVSGMTFAVSDLISARGKLENTGFTGNVVCVLGSTEFGELMNDVITNKYTFAKNDEIISRGYQGRLFDIDIVTVPDAYLPTAGSQKYGAMFFDTVGIGCAYHNPLIQVKQSSLDIGNFYMGAKAEFGVSYISPDAGIKLQS